MAILEIDENEYNRLKNVANLAAAIHANPEGRKLLEQAHRTVNPKAPAPTLENESRMAEPIQALQKQLSDVATMVKDRFEKEEADKKLDAIKRQQDEAFDRLVNNSGYRPEGIEAVKKIMTEKGILDVEVAASYFERISPPQAPVTPTGSNAVNFIEAFNDDSDKALQQLLQSRGESEQALNKLVSDALNDSRKTPARR
jgi:hypothetical protein